MSKILIILQREYLTRVRKRSFIVMTLLGPLLFAVIIILPVWLTDTEDRLQYIQVVNADQLFEQPIQKVGTAQLVPVPYDLDMARQELKEGSFQGIVYFPTYTPDQPARLLYVDMGRVDQQTIRLMEHHFQKKWEKYCLERAELSTEQQAKLEKELVIKYQNMAEGDELSGKMEAKILVGYAFSFLIYFFIFYYGTQIMRGVVEEKRNRIIEIMASSVRPVQMMMGKIIGIASLGLTQFLFWVVFTFVYVQLALMLFGLESLPDTGSELGPGGFSSSVGKDWSSIWAQLLSLNYAFIFLSFLAYFVFGYFLYGGLFAAVGSAMGDDTDAQQFLLPITLPLILSILVLGAVLKNPDGSLAFWMSIIPFTSPVVMMMRIPFEVPGWELLLSLGVLLLTFLFTTWVAGRIYKVAIVSHGSGSSYRKMWRWFLGRH